MSKSAKQSAGLLPFRIRDGELEVMLVHPGGPFWKKKDAGAWTIAKGEHESDEDALAAAERELQEETGFAAAPPFIPLGEIQQKSGKRVQAWAFEADFDVSALVSNDFELEWPPRSGKRGRFPEVDRAAYFRIPEAESKINSAQIPLLIALMQHLSKKSE